MTSKRRRIILFIAAASMGGVGGGLRFAFADLNWSAFFAGLFGVFVFSTAGTALRIALQDYAVWRHRHLRIGMLAANLIGTGAIALALEHPQSIFGGVAFAVGFCGGLTTFSGFVAETLLLLQHHHRRRAFIFATATLVLSILLFGMLHRPPAADAFPWRTMVVNLTGCLTFGVIDKAVDPLAQRSALHRLLLSGLLGGYTTLSSLVAETIALAAANPAAAAMNIAIQITLGAGLLSLGRAVGIRFASTYRSGLVRGLPSDRQQSSTEKKTPGMPGAV